VKNKKPYPIPHQAIAAAKVIAEAATGVDIHALLIASTVLAEMARTSEKYTLKSKIERACHEAGMDVVHGCDEGPYEYYVEGQS